MKETVDHAPKESNSKLFYYILIALILGVVVGECINRFGSDNSIRLFSENVKLLGTVFIRLIQMIIAPLVFSTITVGVCKMGDMKMVGRR